MDPGRLRSWQRIQALVWLAAGGHFVGVTIREVGPAPESALRFVALLAAISYAILFARISERRPADWVTLARVVMLGGVLCLAGGGPPDWPLWSLAAVTVGTDLVDGWLARRTGASQAGAVLDMEADQLVTVGLAVLAVAAVGVGTWALLLPAFRYLYVLLGWVLALPFHDPKPKGGDNRRARVVCAGMMVLLLVAIAPGVPHGARVACLAAAILALLWSYGDDVRYLLARRGT